MPTFAYTARDQQGNIQEGTADGDNAQAVTRDLREKGLWVQKVDAARSVQQKAPKAAKAKKEAAEAPAAPEASGGLASQSRKKQKIGKIKGKDLTMFCRQFATMINAGVSMVRCLAVLEQQAGSPNLKRVIREVAYNVEGGETLTRSLSQFPHIFSNLFIGLVRAGEVGGVLDETLDRLSTFLEEDL